MQIVTHRFLGMLLASVLLVFPVCAADSVFTGAFEGTGRACYGGLYIRTKTISWLTPFSQCQRVLYEVIEHGDKGNQRQFAFHLKQRSKGCRFDVLYLYHADTPNPDAGWHVIGYSSVEDYRTDKLNGYKGDAPQSQSCSLVTR